MKQIRYSKQIYSGVLTALFLILMSNSVNMYQQKSGDSELYSAIVMLIFFIIYGITFIYQTIKNTKLEYKL